MKIPPVDMFYLAGERPLIGDMLAWAYRMHGNADLAQKMTDMAEFGRNRNKPSAMIIPFNKPEVK